MRLSTDCISVESSQDNPSNTSDSNPINLVAISDTVCLGNKDMYTSVKNVDINEAALILLTFKYSLLKKHLSSRYQQNPVFIYPYTSTYTECQPPF